MVEYGDREGQKITGKNMLANEEKEMREIKGMESFEGQERDCAGFGSTLGASGERPREVAPSMSGERVKLATRFLNRNEEV